MIAAACLSIALAVLALTALIAYWIGRTRKLRTGEGYLTGRAAGIRIGRAEHEHVRDALQAELDRMCAALDELGDQYDRQVARRFVPTIVRTVYDHERTGL